MSNPVAARRADIARAFSSKRCEPPRLEHTRVRYSLGTSISELKVPFHATPETARIFTASGRQLAFLLLSRHRDLLPGDELDRFLISEEFGSIPAASRCLSAGGGGPDTRAAAELGLRLHPALTGGVMVAWLGPGGGGRSLVAVIIEVLRKGFAEMRASRGREETPALAALMLSSLLPVTEAGIRGASIPPPFDRYLRGAAGVGVWLALRLAVERVLREVKAPADLAMRVEAPLSPAALLGGRNALGGCGARLYGADLSGGMPAVEETFGRLSAGADVRGAEDSLAKLIAADEALARHAEKEASLAIFRERFLQLALLGEAQQLPAELVAFASARATQPALLPGLLASEKDRKALAKDLAKAAEGRPETTQAVLADLGAALKGFKEKDPAGSVGSSRAAAHAGYADACFAATADLWLERALMPSRRALEVRTGGESEGGLDGEYAAGRLYRLSAGEGPLLKSAVSASLAHLFVDVKDFTRRTNLLGQAAIAEFLRREFYLPILGSAKEHAGGMSHLVDRGGVSINNLLGDAISMSGDVEALVALALHIRRHLSGYERQLAKAVSGEQVARAIESIEEEYARRARSLPPGAGTQLAGQREAALARARGEGLEAGVFVSFGPAPLVLTIEDEIFGRQRVAIAERINESARGTARSGGARARADALLAAERTRRGDPKLTHPWAVFVGAPFAIPIPVAAEEAARAAARAGNLPAAMRAVADTVKTAIEQTARGEERPADIYNAGAAVSEEALLAFQEASGDRRIFKTLELEPEQLHPDLRARYHFAPEPLRLVASFKPDATLAELFRFAGRATFKGLERSGGIGIWELVGDPGVLGLFVLHHAAEWFKR